jgi:glyoxylase-like metal-dependent hydrolase (beta-lactamase superfamily II)
MSDIRLYMFECGTLKCKVHDIKMNQGLGDPYEIPVPWFYLQHPKGNLVIDGGIAIECAGDPRKHWGAIVDVYFPTMTAEQGCVNELKRIGVTPEEISYVLFSHLHLDHTGAAGRFPNAMHVVQRAEYEYAFTPDWFAAGGYIRADYDRPGLNWMFLEGSATDYYDLYGDGVVTMIFSPGHAPGHQSFLINLPKTGSKLLTIDAVYTIDHWNEKALPGFLTSTVDTVRSVRKLHQVQNKTGAEVITGHDPYAWLTFKKAPEYYD